jgi:hypothetical protein
LQHFAAATDAPVVFHTGTGETVAAEIATVSRQTAAALPGILRAFHGHTQLKIIFSGSAIRTIDEMRAPLYGRFDLTLQLHQFRPHEAALMLPDLTPADRARVYGIAGGTPLYLSWWDQRASITENLLELAGRPGSPLLTEGLLVMATEVGAGEHMSPVYEEAFRDYLRRLANEGALGEGIVAIGPWWTDNSQQEIDAVVLAQRELTRVPVLAGESKWAHSVDAVRIKAGLIRKAAALTPDVAELSYVVCARDEVEHPDTQTRAVTATDIFTA